ncbi:MAG: succinate dehydrogenase cytochrome b subunit [Planctomycetes bacterium]|nr:succinate dehydrogenase cytochrome b subunit [Planctomycetota bacterium]MCB9869401.1 succinate dehydrogenase cytochrome b subunit [Planctomycetota bacterium]MCB9888542.1 succinate dehydrogenase cytochrome b subunit [Planctomycetota bacterium]
MGTRWLANFLGSSIGSKVTVAVSGLVLFGFVLGHLAGNLLVFRGKGALNDYAEFLAHQPGLVWTVRAVLLVALLAHVSMAIRLQLRNRAARPQPYARNATVQASLASRQMLLSGLLVLAYIVYHLLHFTVGATDHAAFEQVEQVVRNGATVQRHDVYRMVVTGFGHVPVAAAYVVANALLAWHLSHGVSSLFQTLGIDDPRYLSWIRRGGIGLAAVIGAGFISIPLCVQLGLIA